MGQANLRSCIMHDVRLQSHKKFGLFSSEPRLGGFFFQVDVCEDNEVNDCYIFASGELVSSWLLCFRTRQLHDLDAYGG
jgi:hypothetical protein